MSDQQVSYFELLQTKLVLLKQMFALISEQDKTLEEGQEKELNKIIQQRESTFDKLKKVENMLAQYAQQNEKNEERCKQISDTVMQWIEKVYIANQANIEKTQKYQDQLNGNMNHIMSGKNAIKNGYFKVVPQIGGYYIDKKIGNKKL